MAFNENECAFCKSEVPSGASVCRYCRAYKGSIMETWGRLPFFGLMFFGFPIVLSFAAKAKMTMDLFLLDGGCF